MDCKSTIIESQCDWLTVTCTLDDKIPRFRAWARRAIAWEEAAANKQRNFVAFGYEGVACGRVRWGARADGDMVQLSGDVASKELSSALDYATNCSRVDLAVTVQLDPPQNQLEHHHYLEYLTAPNREGRRSSASLVQSSDGGATFYLGKRVSDVMLRVYNKQVESGEPRYQACHRYELEIKGDRAVLAATSLSQTVDPGAFCQEAVYDWSTAHNVHPAFTAEQPRRLQPGFKRRSDADTKLLWLERCVSPTVTWLRSFQTEDRVKRALGWVSGDPAELLDLASDRPDPPYGPGGVGDGS